MTNPASTSADAAALDDVTASDGVEASDRVAIRTCPLCEAGCGLEITVRRDAAARTESVVRIRGDMNDVFSRGYICPKGSTLKQLHKTLIACASRSSNATACTSKCRGTKHGARSTAGSMV